VVYGQIPYGLPVIAGGMAMVVHLPGITDALWYATLGFAVIGMLLWFWHPYPIRPKWLRNAWGN
jgi:hypothetical protein